MSTSCTKSAAARSRAGTLDVDIWDVPEVFLGEDDSNHPTATSTLSAAVRRLRPFSAEHADIEVYGIVQDILYCAYSDWVDLTKAIACDFMSATRGRRDGEEVRRPALRRDGQHGNTMTYTPPPMRKSKKKDAADQTEKTATLMGSEAVRVSPLGAGVTRSFLLGRTTIDVTRCGPGNSVSSRTCDSYCGRSPGLSAHSTAARVVPQAARENSPRRAFLTRRGSVFHAENQKVLARNQLALVGTEGAVVAHQLHDLGA